MTKKIVIFLNLILFLNPLFSFAQVETITPLESDIQVLKSFDTDIMGQYIDYDFNQTLYISEFKTLTDGVEVLVQAYQGSDRLGFGADKNIETERIRIHNPPMMIADGTYTLKIDELGREVNYANYRYDPVLALRYVLAKTVEQVSEISDTVVSGSIGHTVDVYYPDANAETTSVDGRVQKYLTSSDWATVRNFTSGTNNDAEASANGVGAYNSGADYEVTRTFLLFDTSSLPDTDTISSAVLSVVCTAKTNGDNDGTDYISPVVSSPAADTSLVTGDFDQFLMTDLSYGVLTGKSILQMTDTARDISAITCDSSTPTTWDLNATGISYIIDTGISKFGLAEGHDITDSAVSGGYNQISIYYADETGTTNDPSLTITHTASEGGGGGVIFSEDFPIGFGSSTLGLASTTANTLEFIYEWILLLLIFLLYIGSCYIGYKLIR